MALAGASGGGEPPPRPPHRIGEREVPEDAWKNTPSLPPKRKPRRGRTFSAVWPYFQVEGRVNREQADLVRCKLCREVLRRGDRTKGARGLTTSGMWYHLFRFHWDSDPGVTDEFRRVYSAMRSRVLHIDTEEPPEEEAAQDDAETGDGIGDPVPSTSQTTPTPTPLPGYAMVLNIPMNEGSYLCNRCMHFVVTREPDVARFIELVSQHTCGPRP